MRITYRNSADFDLEEIEAWYKSRSPQGYISVFKDISRALKMLSASPKIGRIVSPEDGIRRVVTAKYGFSISYVLGEDVIEILGIYRYQSREF